MNRNDDNVEKLQNLSSSSSRLQFVDRQGSSHVNDRNGREQTDHDYFLGRDDLVSLVISEPKNNMDVYSDNMQVLADVKMVLKRRQADFNTVHMGSTLLHWATARQRPSLVRLMLSHKVDPNALNYIQESPLMWAAKVNDTASALLLLNAGADPTYVVESTGESAVHFAARSAATTFIDVLRSKNVDIDRANKAMDTPLHLALKGKHTETARMLTEWGADVSVPDAEGNTPLHLATVNGDAQIVRFIMNEYSDDRRAASAWVNTRQESVLKLASTFHDGTLRRFMEPSICKMSCLDHDRTSPFDKRWTTDLWPALYVVLSMLVVIVEHALLLYARSDTLPFVVHAVIWVLEGLAVVSWILTSTIEPGYMPREHPASFPKKYIKWLKQGRVECICALCRVVQPVRSKHCKICDRCVRGFDHHCPWTMNCIGENNYRYFMCFMLSVVPALFIIVVANVVYVVAHVGSCCILGVMIAIVVSLNCCGLMAFAGQLCFFHLNLIRHGLTTYESIKNRTLEYMALEDGQFYNPYDQGCMRNVCITLGCVRQRKIKMPMIPGHIRQINTLELAHKQSGKPLRKFKRPLVEYKQRPLTSNIISKLNKEKKLRRKKSDSSTTLNAEQHAEASNAYVQQIRVKRGVQAQKQEKEVATEQFEAARPWDKHLRNIENEKLERERAQAKLEWEQQLAKKYQELASNQISS